MKYKVIAFSFLTFSSADNTYGHHFTNHHVLTYQSQNSFLFSIALCCLKKAYFCIFQVVDDIYLQLKLKKPVAKFKASCFRSNLFYDIQFKDALDDPFDELRDFVVEALGENWEENRTVSEDVDDFVFVLKNET